MARNNDIVDWAKTVKDTLSQLGNKQKPAKPRPRVQYSSLSQTSRERHRNRVEDRRRRNRR